MIVYKKNVAGLQKLFYNMPLSEITEEGRCTILEEIGVMS